jgi:AraC-like DNA-binding protein
MKLVTGSSVERAPQLDLEEPRSDSCPLGWTRGVETRTLFASSVCRVGRWSCVVGSSESFAEQRQLWPMISFTYGGAYVIRAQGRSALVDANCTLVLHPKVTYTMRRHYGPRASGSYFLIRPDLLEEARFGLRERRPFLELRGPSSAECFLKQRLVVERAEKAGVDALEIEEQVLDLVSRTLASDPPDSTIRGDLAEAAKQVLSERLSEPARLEDIARSVEVSPFHLCRTFKRATGLSLHQDRVRLRLRKAFERISAGERDLGRIALDLGFSNHSHLTTCFRREFGLTPSAWRRRLAG